MGSYNPISRIAIIGAGPTGLACTKYLLAEQAFSEIDVFEQRDCVGGVWNMSSTERSKRIPIPQEDPTYGSVHQNSSVNSSNSSGSLPNGVNNDSLEFESPLYEYLEANIPKQVMQFSDSPFPDQCPLYPSRHECLEYIQRYADGVRHMIKFGTQVQNVKLVDNASSAHDKWEVVYRNLANGTISHTTYDAVIVASGHYTVPQVTAIKGVAEWHKAHPGVLIHSKAFRRPEPFEGQRVLVIGNSASGTDIAMQIGPMSSRLYWSSRSESIFEKLERDWLEHIDEIVEFLPPEKFTRAVKTKSGKIVDNLDAVIFATGYLYSFPFLSELDPPLITDGLRTRETYQHLFYIEHPTLALPVLNHKIVPFALAENQAAVIGRMWSGRLPTPSKGEMRRWEASKLEEMGPGKNFHLMKFPNQPAQLNELYRWAMSASPRDGLENDGIGKVGQHYDRRSVWERMNVIDIKVAYASKGEERRKYFTVEELGFNYEDWLKKATPDDMKVFEEAKCIE